MNETLMEGLKDLTIDELKELEEHIAAVRETRKQCCKHPWKQLVIHDVKVVQPAPDKFPYNTSYAHSMIMKSNPATITVMCKCKMCGSMIWKTQELNTE